MMFDPSHMANGMMLGMGLFWLLAVTVMVLSGIALIKYIFVGGLR